ncbi:hypothetical protein B0A48_15411 [Cryoendolithus antarcticus]|uniref:Uncharacterized protein n=1 Tax=Cryoendolithus antarcticus TaxID=1507870 RepID=A0A1V8SHX2_9PEZI|nr:hypothetical protein B0A48_15411 [Cryoendolithus antarcticus]
MDLYPDLRPADAEESQLVSMITSDNGPRDTFFGNIAIRSKEGVPLSTTVWDKLTPELRYYIYDLVLGDAAKVLVHAQPVLHGIFNTANPIESHLSSPTTLMGVSRWFRADVLADAVHHLHTTERRTEILIHVPDLDFRGAKVYCQQVPMSEIQRMRSAIPDLKSAEIRLSFSTNLIGSDYATIDFTKLDTWLAYRDALAVSARVSLRYRTHCIGTLTYNPQLPPFDGRPFDRPEMRMMDTLGNAIRGYGLLELATRTKDHDVMHFKGGISTFVQSVWWAADPKGMAERERGLREWRRNGSWLPGGKAGPHQAPGWKKYV